MLLFAQLIESEWIEGIRAGDERAFRKLFDRFYTPLAVFAAEHVGSYDAGREITQEVFIKIWNKRADWNPAAGALKTYLYRAVYNQCLNYIKKETTRKKYEEESSQLVLAVSDPADDSTMEHELMAALDRAVKRLPKRRQAVFVLHRQHEMSVKEVAEVLDISPKTVENLMGLALKDLRMALENFLK
ncbi:MAG: RNA polymerase sigma-70 factor [Bacteroidetes bacterium]|nr:RNA polymerase sigma-70 factor [Bacteroidota bacterium]MCH8525442.1 RNA polymerase sigma-70 factor [Balneolales bacterium]